MRHHRLSAALVLALALAACGNDEPTDDPGAASPTDEGTATADTGSDTAAGGEVDTSTAEPGAWPVGEAGDVTFAIEGGQPVLVDHAAADGWTATVETEDDDELAVDFRRDGEAYDFDVEVEGDTLEVEVQHEIEGAEPGSFDLPDSGTFAFEADGGTITLTDLTPGDGWEVTEEDDDDDGVEFTLTSGDREVDVEIEVDSGAGRDEGDDGRVDVAIDYRVRGTVPA